MATTRFIDMETAAASELARLTNDPALVYHPDSLFRAKFRNPDETVEAELEEIDTVTVAIGRDPTLAPACCESPKD